MPEDQESEIPPFTLDSEAHYDSLVHGMGMHPLEAREIVELAAGRTPGQGWVDPPREEGAGEPVKG